MDVKFRQLIESYSGLLYEIFISEEKSSMYHYNLNYKVPVIIISGDNDWTTPYSEAFRYFNDISAPAKEFITIRDVGHIPFVDRPKEFSEALLKVLNK